MHVDEESDDKLGEGNDALEEKTMQEGQSQGFQTDWTILQEATGIETSAKSRKRRMTI